MTYQQQISLSTKGHGDMHDLTEQIALIVNSSGIKTGLMHVSNVGSTAALGTKAAAAQQNLRNIKQALERLQQGSFGECAACGGDIELKRLETIPWASYCVKCQEASEQGGGR